MTKAKIQFPKAVLFDMDGVLIDSEPLSDAYFSVSLQRYNIPANIEFLQRFRGLNSYSFWTILKDEHKLEETIEVLIARERIGYLAFLKTQRLKPMKGVKKLLNDLQQHNILLGLASSAGRDRIDFFLEQIRLQNTFSVIVSGDDVTKGKPHPEIYLKTAELLSVSPKDCVVIEDATHGVMAAKSAGMKVIGFKDTNNPQDVSMANKIVSRLSDINMVLLQQL